MSHEHSTGDILVDIEENKPVVLITYQSIPANQYNLDNYQLNMEPVTVASTNPDYPAEDTVVLVVNTQDLFNLMEAWWDQSLDHVWEVARRNDCERPLPSERIQSKIHINGKLLCPQCGDVGAEEEPMGGTGNEIRVRVYCSKCKLTYDEFTLEST